MKGNEITFKHTSKTEGYSSSSVSDINVDDFSTSSEEYDSDELDENTTTNPHGFIYSDMLNTY